MKKARKLKAPARLRRDADEARASILAVAEEMLLHGGPEAIRVKDVAERAGLTHPTLLHHFGSREGLMMALVRRATERIQTDVSRIFAEMPAAPGEAKRTIAVFDRAAAEIEELGLARLLAWLVLSGRLQDDFFAEAFQPLVDTVHAARCETRRQEGGSPPDLLESRYGVAFVLLNLFSDALFGSVLRKAVGLPDSPEVAAGFRRHLAQLTER